MTSFQADFDYNYGNDPAADFLAREQSQLADLADELNGAMPPLKDPSSSILSEESSSPPSREFETKLSILKSVKPQREEPEKIKKWRAEQIKRLAKKDAEEEKKKEEWRAIAKQELEEWTRKQNELIGKSKASNRETEKQLMADTNRTEGENEWERVAKLCEFNPKFNRSTKDTSHMKSILLQLKQTPLKKKAGGK